MCEINGEDISQNESVELKVDPTTTRGRDKNSLDVNPTHHSSPVHEVGMAQASRRLVQSVVQLNIPTSS